MIILFLASAFFQKNNFIFLQIPCLFLKSQTERFFSCFFIAILQREKTKRSMKKCFLKKFIMWQSMPQIIK
ncbi:hypothetical protein D3064_06535 [Enterococcus faecalis]|nr:hypothetical protein [Enterococcus faecalis]